MEDEGRSKLATVHLQCSADLGILPRGDDGSTPPTYSPPSVSSESSCIVPSSSSERPNGISNTISPYRKTKTDNNTAARFSFMYVRPVPSLSCQMVVVFLFRTKQTSREETKAVEKRAEGGPTCFDLSHRQHNRPPRHSETAERPFKPGDHRPFRGKFREPFCDALARRVAVTVDQAHDRPQKRPRKTRNLLLQPRLQKRVCFFSRLFCIFVPSLSL